MKHIKEFRLVENSEPEIRRKYYPDGSVEKEIWFLNNEWHREDGPAWIGYFEDGSIKSEGWYIRNKAHREDGPANIYYYPGGSVDSEGWFLNGINHREDGPAAIYYYPDGNVKSKVWYLYSSQLTKAEWVEQTPGLSPEELVEISTNDPDPEVRRAARKNPNFPEDLEGWAINLDDWT